MKKLLIISSVIIVLLVVLLLVVPFFIDLNRFSGKIEEKIENTTGLDAHLGKISLSLLPRPAFKIKGLSLKEKDRDDNIFNFEKLTVKPVIFPLLKGNIRIKSVVIDEPVIDLPLDKDWDSRIEKRKSAGNNDKAGLPDFHLNRFKIKNGKVRVFSSTMDHTFTALNLDIKDMSTSQDWKLGLSALHQNSGKSVEIKGTFSPLSLETVNFSPFKVKLGTNSFSGAMKWEGGDNQFLNFELNSDKNMNIDELLSLLSAGETSTKSTAGKKKIKSSPSSNLTVEGKFTAPVATYNGMKLSNLVAGLNYRKGKAKIAPIQFELYDGNFDGQATAHISGLRKGYKASTVLKDVNIAPLLEDMAGVKDVISGRLVSDMKLKGPDISAEDMLDSMKGNGAFELFEGRLETFSLEKKINALVGLTGKAGSGKDYTEFSKFSGDLEIKDGKLFAKNVILLSESMEVNAWGNMTFEGILDFSVQAVLSEKLSALTGSSDIATYMKDSNGRTVLPLKIKGPVDDPLFSLDKSQLKKSVGKKLEEKAKDLIFNKLFKKK